MVNDSFSEVINSQKRMVEAFRSPAVEVLKQFSKFEESFKSATAMAEGFKATGEYQRSFFEKMQPVTAVSNISLGISKQMQSTFESYSKMSENLSAAVSQISRVKDAQMSIAEYSSHLNHLREVHLSIAEGLKASGLTDLYDRLNGMGVNEVAGVLEEVTESDLGSKAPETPRKEKLVSELTVGELEEIIESKASMIERDKPSTLKDFIMQVIMSIGVDAVKWVLNIVGLWVYHQYATEVLKYHEVTMLAIQLKGTDSILGAKRYVRKAEPAKKLKYINYMGITRVETVLREGSSRKAPIVENGKLAAKTVVLIEERKGNWIKVHVIDEDEELVGWVEESKVIRFHKQKTP